MAERSRSQKVEVKKVLLLLAERSRSQKVEVKKVLLLVAERSRSQKVEVKKFAIAVAERSRSQNVDSMKGYIYILKCSDGSYYTGSTVDLTKRTKEHQDGKGANHTKKRLPVELLYVEEYRRIDTAFYREKQIQGWSRTKKEALINGKLEELGRLAECQNETNYKYYKEEI